MRWLVEQTVVAVKCISSSSGMPRHITCIACAMDTDETHILVVTSYQNICEQSVVVFSWNSFTDHTTAITLL